MLGASVKTRPGLVGSLLIAFSLLLAGKGILVVAAPAHLASELFWACITLAPRDGKSPNGFDFEQICRRTLAHAEEVANVANDLGFWLIFVSAIPLLLGVFVLATRAPAIPSRSP